MDGLQFFMKRAIFPGINREIRKENTREPKKGAPQPKIDFSASMAELFQYRNPSEKD